MGRRARARRGPLQHRERKESNWRERGWAKILKLRSIQYSACKRYRWECKNDLRCSIANSHLVVRIICSEERVHRSWISSRFVLGAFGREYINSCATSGVHEINEWSINHGMDLSLKFCSKIYNKPLLANIFAAFRRVLNPLVLNRRKLEIEGMYWKLKECFPDE